ncbi:MAG TPA: vitamin B12-dependent ribonucleotide reductase, partial [Nocardioidaceae bacterium]|nr:vitamin B12-dependent ribonucleotide reductase [Nocardioidaceae bacterium]
GYFTAGSYPDDGLGEIFLKLGKQGSTLAGMMDAFSLAISIALQYGVPLETYVSKFTNMKFEPAGLTDDPDVRMAQSIVDYIFRRLALDHLPFESRAALGIYTAEERQRQLDTGSYELPEVTEISEAESLKTSPSATTATSSDLDDDVPSDAAVTASTSGSAIAADHSVGVDVSADEAAVVAETAKPVAGNARTSAELLEVLSGREVDSPLCMTCGTKMRPAGSCYVCEGCGSTSGCS